MTLDFTSLEKALDQLAQSLEYCESDLAKKDAKLFFHLRAGAIQAFEFSYELSIKMLRRQLSEIESPEEIKRLSFRDLIRSGAESGFIDDPTHWFQFREFRNMTSHTYDEKLASKIYEILPLFVGKAGDLLEKLKAHSVEL